MAELPGAGRLDPETLAAFIDGLLPPEERAKVQAEIAADPETYEWVVNAVNAVEDASVVTPVTEHGPVTATADEPHHAGEVHRTAGPRRADDPRAGGGGSDRRVLPFTRRRAFMGALGALAAAAVVILAVQTQPAWWQRLTGPQADPRFAKLVEAVGEERYIEARLTGGFKYGPMRQVMRGPGDSDSRPPSLLSLAASLERESTAEPAVLHASGVAKLLVGGDQLDAGVTQLEAASAIRRSPVLDADLAAAYIARWYSRGIAEDLARAIDSATRSVSAAPELAEAQFNLALAFELAGRIDDARRAWRLYLTRAPDDGWARLARERLAALTPRDADSAVPSGPSRPR
jgi:hypothetical protein